MKIPSSLSRPDSATEVAHLWFIVALAILVVCFPAAAQNLKHSPSPVATNDWTQFRGPQSNPVGTHPRLAERWSRTENVEWSQEIPGRGWSSPIVTGGKVFVTTVTTDGKSKSPQIGTEYSEDYVQELLKQGLSMKEIIDRLTARDIELPHEVITVHYFLYCLNLKNGKVDWKKEFYTGRPPGGRHRKNSFVSESPVTDGKHVYVYVANLGVWAFDVNGKLAWNTRLEPSPHQLDVGTGSSPVLTEKFVVVLNDNEKRQYIAAFDKQTGKTVWRTDRDLGGKGIDALERSGWATPFVWRHTLRTEIVTVGPGQAISYDLAGKELWRISGMSVTPIPTPFSYDGLLYVNGGRGAPMFAIRPGAAGDISLRDEQTSNAYVVWSQPRAGTYLPSALAYDGAIYTLTETGILSRFDAKTGSQTYKTRIDPAATAFTTSPWIYNGKLFCLSEEGQTFVIKTGEQFELLHMNELDDMTLASPALAGDRLLIRTERRLYSIRRKDLGSASTR